MCCTSSVVNQYATSKQSFKFLFISDLKVLSHDKIIPTD